MKKLITIFVFFFSTLIFAQTNKTIETGCIIMKKDNEQIKIILNDPDIDSQTKKMLRETYKANADMIALHCKTKTASKLGKKKSSYKTSAISFMKKYDRKIYNRINFSIYEDETISALDKIEALEMACQKYIDENNLNE